MQFTTEINKDKRLAHIKVTGRAGPRIFREAIMNAFWDDAFDPTYAQLIDLAEMEGFPIIGDAEDVHDVFRAMKNMLKGKIAVVAANAAVLTIAKLVSMLAAKEGLRLEVFRDIDKAKEWLGVE